MLRFDDWVLDNDERAGVMAGQHWIEIVCEYVTRIRGSARDLYYVCRFYNKGP